MARSTADLNQKLKDCPDKKEEATPFLDDIAFLDIYKGIIGEENVLTLKQYLENPPAQKSSVDATPERKITLQHVKQMHMPRVSVSVVTPIVKEHVSYSQYHVARTILANPNTIVLDEGLYEDCTPETAEKLKKDPMGMFVVAKIIFPDGIPDQFEKLNQLQKDFIAEVGAPIVLFYLDQLTHVYKTSSEEENKKLESAVAKGDYSMVYEPREKQALFWAKQAAIKSGKNHILLIYGADHNFERHKDILSKEGIDIQMSLDTRKPRPTASPFPMFAKDKFSSLVNSILTSNLSDWKRPNLIV